MEEEFSALPIEFNRKNSVSPTNFLLSYLSLGQVRGEVGVLSLIKVIVTYIYILFMVGDLIGYIIHIYIYIYIIYIYTYIYI